VGTKTVGTKSSVTFVCAFVYLYCLSMVLAQDQADQGEKNEPAPEQKKEKILFTTEAPQRKQSCRSGLSFEYFQIGDDVNVAGQLTNDGCAAASGEYTVSVRYRTEDGEIENKDFVELWTREDNTPIEFDKNYPMGPDTYLIRVRTKRSKCVCTAPEAQTEKHSEE